MAWTTPVDQTTGTLVTAAIYNAQIIDNLSYLHGDAGTIDISAGHNQLKTDNISTQPNAGVGGFAFQTQISGDTTARFGVLGSGLLDWGPGNAAIDIQFGRAIPLGGRACLLLLAGNGIGYGAGTGGAVTQTTSKSTGVTLNTPCGQITINNAALAAGASVSFNLSNNTILAGDLVVLNPQVNSNYRFEAVAVINGQVTIRITNVTAGSLSEAILVNFAVLKAVNN